MSLSKDFTANAKTGTTSCIRMVEEAVSHSFSQQIYPQHSNLKTTCLDLVLPFGRQHACRIGYKAKPIKILPERKAAEDLTGKTPARILPESGPSRIAGNARIPAVNAHGPKKLIVLLAVGDSSAWK